MLESLPGTNQYKAMTVKVHTQGTNQYKAMRVKVHTQGTNQYKAMTVCWSRNHRAVIVRVLVLSFRSLESHAVILPLFSQREKQT